MPTLKFADNSTMECQGVHSNTAFYQGVERQCLTFLFDQDKSLTELQEKFTAENLAAFYIIDDSGEYLYENYTIRISLGCGEKERVLVSGVAVLADKEFDTVAYVQMAQSTLAERAILGHDIAITQQQEVIDSLLIASLETGNMDTPEVTE